jgi:uncharacterized protein (DUF2236 family)
MGLLDRIAAPLLSRELSFPEDDFSQPRGEPAIVPPDSVSWRVFSNPVALYVGGVAAVLLQLGEPRVRTGVWQYGSFRKAPRERMRRTGLGAMITVFGARSRFEAYVAEVNRMHAQVAGVTEDGTPFRASDPELLLWVQGTAAFAFSEAYAHARMPPRRDPARRVLCRGGTWCAPLRRCRSTLFPRGDLRALRAVAARTGAVAP